MRTLLVALTAASAIVVGVIGAEAASPAVGSAQYVVQPDPRLCPSPRCGGYWVTFANRSRTRCADGAVQPRCYVARAVDEKRQPLSGLPAGTLARAAIEPWSFDGVGRLGLLVVADIRVPVGNPTDAPLYRVRDTGIRCVRAPCFFMRARLLSTRSTVTVSDLDLYAVRLNADEQLRAAAALETSNGLFLAGRIGRAPDGGRRLLASRVYLRP